MSKSRLETRLARQVGNAGLARNLLIQRGHMRPDGSLTEAGSKRQALGNAGRAKDRASKRSGHPPSDYTYNPKTNQATLKRKGKRHD